MFGRFKKKPEPEKTNVTEEPKVSEETSVNEESKSDANEKTESVEKPRKKAEKTKRTKKLAKEDKNNNPIGTQAPADMTAKTKPFIGIKEYSSVSEITESIDRELAETKSKLGEYLRQIDDKRAVAERTQRLYDIVTKIAGRKPSKGTPNRMELNGLEIILDANVLNELTAIEDVVKSHQQRLIALEKARDALQTLNQADETEGIKYLAFEKEGIPEQILLKLS